ncbi:MAG TPA: double zinc ribbon domain-containing protein [Lachnospiraceae bacterium]|nr:double zinc ribbon domain-containing protein [Lachnospiraceae bacterium]
MIDMLDLFFPRRCILCDSVVYPKGNLICTECLRNLKYIKEPFCCKCGKQLTEKGKEYCFDCATKPHKYTKGRALFEYDCIHGSIYKFKYQGREEYSKFYGKEVVKHLGKEILSWNAQALIPVPLHKSRMKKRGFNQTLLIATEISKYLGIPVNDSLIARCKNTIPQKELDDRERQNNLKRAFKIVRNDVKLSTIIIIDDIYTTGSTINAMTEQLKAIGIENIYFITLSVGKGL